PAWRGGGCAWPGLWTEPPGVSICRSPRGSPDPSRGAPQELRCAARARRRLLRGRRGRDRRAPRPQRRRQVDDARRPRHPAPLRRGTGRGGGPRAPGRRRPRPPRARPRPAAGRGLPDARGAREPALLRARLRARERGGGAERLCARVVLLDRGRVVAAGTPAALVAGAGLRPILRLRTGRPLPPGWLAGVAGATLADPSAPETTIAVTDTATAPAILAAALRAGGDVLEMAQIGRAHV